MDINGVGASADGRQQDAAIARPGASANPNKMAIGDQLNAMSGITDGKTLYGEKKVMDKDAFLKMFMEQLKYQDPLKPQSSDQFTQQMAQFSQLEQSLETNKHLSKMISQQNNMQVAALQLVGKNILADRSGLYHDKGKVTAMSFTLPNDMTDMKIEVVNPEGSVAKTYKVGDRNAGAVTWKWDGTLDNGANADTGKYTYRVSGKGIDGKDSTINTKVDGRVSGVTSSNGIVYLLVGEQKIALNDVETIKDPNAVDPNSSTNAKVRPAVFKPAGQAAVASGDAASEVTANADTPAAAPDGSIAGVASEQASSQKSDDASSVVAGTNTESIKKNGQTADSNDGAASQNWDRLNPLMPLNLR